MAAKVALTSLKANIEVERSGDWVDLPDVPGVRLQVRSLNYAPYRMAHAAMIQRRARTNKGKPANPDDLNVEVGKLFAEHILLNWDGFDVPYSKEKAMELLSDLSYRPLVGQIEWAASQVGQTEIEFVSDAAKNSAAPSATLSGGAAQTTGSDVSAKPSQTQQK